MSNGQGSLFFQFGSQFLENHVGKAILGNPLVALTELVANAWDAGATDVRIQWPQADGDTQLMVCDNGSGMLRNEFEDRWRTLSYSRLEAQGEMAEFPPSVSLSRKVFGKNGVGRHSPFCFSDVYEVESKKNGKRFCAVIKKAIEHPFEIEVVTESKANDTGTTIRVDDAQGVRMSVEEVKSELGMRFLVDPNFEVYVNGEKVVFKDLPSDKVAKTRYNCSDGCFSIISIDLSETDRNTQRHGVAWHVDGRMVGECDWNIGGFSLDGRRKEAKRFTFIVEADLLKPDVRKDWTGFAQSERFEQVANMVEKHVREYIANATKKERDAAFGEIKSENASAFNTLTKTAQKRWVEFVKRVQVECPGISEKDLSRLAGILANLEETSSKYSLLKRLSDLGSKDLDRLNDILSSWTVETATLVLDEIRTRCMLIEELKKKVDDSTTKEVQELQPLFERALWVFGPEFESIEYTSNQTMAKVVKQLFSKDSVSGEGGRNRPDFAIVPNGSAGFYTISEYLDYEEGGGESAVSKLIVVELKRPGIKIGDEEKDQCRKYVRELQRLGYVKGDTQVRCFILGSEVDPFAGGVMEDGPVKYYPLAYMTILDRASSRLFRLERKIKSAPFMSDNVMKDLEEAPEVARQIELHNG